MAGINLDELKPYVVTPEINDKIWLFYGEMGTRKTSVSCQFPNSLLIAFDIGYKFVLGNNFVPAPVQSWSDFKSIVKQLELPKNKQRFKTVIIDTIGMCYNACYDYMLTQMGVSDPGEVPYGMGWKKIRLEFEKIVRSIAQKGYGLIMLGHSDEVEKEDKITKEKKLTTKIDIDKRPDIIIKQLADFVFFLHKEVNETTGEPTVYAYSNLIDIDTKSRSKYIDRKFEFTYENLPAELQRSVQRQYEEAGLTMPTNVVQDNPYEIKKEDFSTVQKEVIEYATLLVDKGYADDVNNLLMNVFKGVKVSELRDDEDTLKKLIVVRSTLSELKSKAKL